MKVAITGGIGAGKSFVCQRLRLHYIDVYDCDEAAKRLMTSSAPLKKALCRLVGKDVYLSSSVLNKPLLAKFLLESEANQQALNDIVHPAVARDFMESGKDWLESAIFFDSGFNRRIDVDMVLCVSAPLEVRLRRIMERDDISREKALEWVHRQLPQEEVERRSDYVILNDGVADIDQQIKHILTLQNS